MSSKKQYPALDGLRAFSAVGIALMHILANGSYSLSGFVFDRLIPSFTHLVFLFMIISSFGVCCGYYEKVIQGKFDIEGFYRKRLQKIWPFFALMCLFECAVTFSPEALWETLANLSMFFGFMNQPMQVIGVGWFLGIVMIFYMIFPFFCCLIRDKRRAWICLGILAVVSTLSEYHFGLTRSNFAYSFVFFATGGVLYLYREKLADFSASYRWLVLLLCAAAAAVYYCVGYQTMLFPALFALVVIYALGSTGKLLDNPVTRYISGISMEIYLCHLPVFRVLEKLKVTTLFGNGAVSYVVTCALTILGAVCVATLYQKTVSFLAGKFKR